jgi:hypothetical protein
MKEPSVRKPTAVLVYGEGSAYVMSGYPFDYRVRTYPLRKYGK